MKALRSEYDLIICGGGLAGLALARQLRLAGMDLSILVLDRLERPLPEAAFKVGESTIEVGAYYYFDRLGLRDYLEDQHLEKLGLRYFYQGGDRFWDRPEYGVRRFLPAKSYQLDRGKLENHLRDLVEAADVDLLEGVQVSDIDIRPVRSHAVTFEAGGERRAVEGRWVVDALGRRRFLQQKFGLHKDTKGRFNSAWFRIRGKLSVADFVPESETGWHGRVDDDRWQSTNHLMGRGYWLWLIPLAPDNTSVGIVASDTVHPFENYNTWEKALSWIATHEPVVAEALEGRTPMDFLKLKGFSYTSKQVFSADRWATVGFAGVFADPYYSVGSNMIAFANGFTGKLIELDAAGELTSDYVDYANRYFLTLNDFLTDTIQRGYANLHNGPITALKTIWDYYIGWTTTDPQFYHQVYLDPARARAMSGVLSRVILAQARMMMLFEDWGRMTDTTGYRFEFIDYIEDLPTLKHLHVRNLPPLTADFRTLLSNVREAVDRIEELAQIIFFLAVDDVLPDHRERFAARPWVNIEAIGLDPDRWEEDRLFEPKTQPRDIEAHFDEIARLFQKAPVGRVVGAE